MRGRAEAGQRRGGMHVRNLDSALLAFIGVSGAGGYLRPVVEVPVQGKERGNHFRVQEVMLVVVVLVADHRIRAYDGRRRVTADDGDGMVEGGRTGRCFSFPGRVI